jgi:hypothetical protein
MSKAIVHCSIQNYLEDQFPKVHGLLAQRCSLGGLRPRRDSSVTFLVPEKSDALAKLLESGKLEDAAKATKYINTHIIDDKFESLEDFQSKPIINRLGNTLSAVMGADKKSVTIGDATIYKPSGRREFITDRDNVAVWVCKGELPEGSKGGSRSKKKVRGGAEGDMRRLVFDILSKQFAAMNPLAPTANPFTRPVESLLDFLAATHGGWYNAILPMVTPDPMSTFYILMEPHKTSGYMLPDDVIEGWNPSNKDLGVTGGGHRKTLLEHVHAGGALYETRGLLDREREAMIQRLVRSPEKIATTEGIQREYRKLSVENKFGSIEHAVPKNTANIWAASPHLKQWQDEVCYLILRSLEDDTPAEDLLHALRTQYPGNDHAYENMICSDLFRSLLAPTELFSTCIMQFLESKRNHFLYLA